MQRVVKNYKEEEAKRGKGKKRGQKKRGQNEGKEGKTRVKRAKTRVRANLDSYIKKHGDTGSG